MPGDFFKKNQVFSDDKEDDLHMLSFPLPIFSVVLPFPPTTRFAESFS
jgi:hypothetical protein